MSERRPTLAQHLVWRLEALGFDLLGLVFRMMPVDVASWVGGAIVRRIGPLTGANKTADRNLRIAFPDMDLETRKRLLVAQWENLGRLTAEFQLMHRLTPNGGRVEIVGGEKLRAVAESGKPAILMSGHFSNFEVMAAVIVHLGVRCQVTYRAANNPYIDQRIVDTRRRYGVALMAPKGGDGSREVLTALAGGEAVSFLNDQKFNRGVMAPFFGVPATTAPGPMRLALKYGCPVIPMSVERIGKAARFRVTIWDSIAPQKTGDRAADILQGVKNVNAFVEARVREHPQEWFWTHKRWPPEVYKALKEQEKESER